MVRAGGNLLHHDDRRAVREDPHVKFGEKLHVLKSYRVAVVTTRCEIALKKQLTYSGAR